MRNRGWIWTLCLPGCLTLAACDGGTVVGGDSGNSGNSGNTGDSGDTGDTGGACSGTPQCLVDAECSAADACSIPRCVECRCIVEPALDGTPCDANDFCSGMRCEAGACVSGTPDLDVDDDGAFTAQCGGTDCDNQDPSVPIAGPETGALCDDGKDNDCDGTPDDLDAGCSGRVCSATGWCWENPLPHGLDNIGVWPFSPDNILYSQFPRGLTRYQSGEYAHIDLTLAGVDYPAQRFWGATPDDLWAVGAAGALRFDGSEWTTVSFGIGFGGADIDGLAADDIWVIGANGDAAHYDGSSWTVETVAADAYFTRVWVADNGDVWAVGYDSTLTGAAYRRTGGTWSLMHQAGSIGSALWGSGPDDVWFAYSGNQVYQWNGTTVVEHTPTPTNWVAIAGLSANKVFAFAPYFHAEWDGSTWTVEQIAWQRPITDAREANGEIAVVGGVGFVARYDGSEFVRLTDTVDTNVIDLEEGPDGTTWAQTITGDLMRRVPSDEPWTEFPAPDVGISLATDFEVLSSGDLLFAASGDLYRNAGSTWDLEAGVTSHAVCEKPNGDVLAVSRGASVLSSGIWEPDGYSVYRERVSDTTALRQLFCLDDNTAWATGHQDFTIRDVVFAMELPTGWAEIGLRPLTYADAWTAPYGASNGQHVLLGRMNDADDPNMAIVFDGGKWHDLSGAQDMLAAGGFGDDHWLVGRVGRAERHTPTGVESHPITTANDIVAVRALASEDVVAVDILGGVYRWQGTDWSVVVTPSGGTFGSAFIGSQDDIWATRGSDVVRLVAGVWTQQSGAPDAGWFTGISTEDLYGIDNFRRLYHYENSTWTELDPPGSNSRDWYAIQVFDSGRAAALTDDDQLALFDGTTWTSVAHTIDRVQRLLVGSDTDDLWLFEEDLSDDIFRAFHWDGSQFAPVVTPTRPLTVAHQGTNDYLLVDDDGAIYSYDGLAFARVADPPDTGTAFYDALIVSATDIWLVSNVTLYRYDGTTWNDLGAWPERAIPATVQRLRQLSTGKILSAGFFGAILSRE